MARRASRHVQLPAGDASEGTCNRGVECPHKQRRAPASSCKAECSSARRVWKHSGPTLHSPEPVMQLTACKTPSGQRLASLAEDGFSLGIQSLPLRRLPVHCTKAGHAQLLARLLHCIAPLLQCALRIILLGSCGCSLTHDLSTLALDQCLLRQAANCLRFLALEDCSFSILSPCDDAHFLHPLHSLHRLHGSCLHRLHACLHCWLAGSLHRKSHIEQARRFGAKPSMQLGVK